MADHQKTDLRIALLENIHPRAVSALSAAGYKVKHYAHSPDRSELNDILAQTDVVGIRSKTQIRADQLERHPHLLAIGCFCIGTDQVDIRAANRLGIPVFNAPYSNTRSVAELVIGEIIALSRQLFDRSQSAHQGGWQKSADGSHEIRGKTLGIVGYGHIGSQLSILAEAMGMRVLYHDIVKKLPLGNAAPAEKLGALLGEADFVSLHVPDTPQTRGLIGSSELKLMKPGAHLINASRGSVVDIGALALALRSGHIGGAAIDVFPREPASNSERFTTELQGLPNVILTPHIGGSTAEAQEAIGLEVAGSFRAFIEMGTTRGAVGFPQVDMPASAPGAERLINVHQNVPGVLREINSLVSARGANILGQALATDSQVGYLILDMEHGSALSLVDEIQKLPTSIRSRALRLNQRASQD